MKNSRWFSLLASFSVWVGAQSAMAEVKVDPNLTVDKSRMMGTTPKVSYNYVGVQYVSQSLDWDPGCTQNGLEVYGNLDIKDGFFASATLGDVSGNPCGSSRVVAGAGYRTPFNEQFDMYGKLQFETISPDAGSSDSGLVLVGGMRGFLTDELEGVFELQHHTAFDGETSINAGGRYWFNPEWAATFDLGFSSDVTVIQLGGRYNF